MANITAELLALRIATIEFCDQKIVENQAFINLIKYAALTPECVKGAKLLPHEQQMLSEGKQMFKEIKQMREQLKKMDEKDLNNPDKLFTMEIAVKKFVENIIKQSDIPEEIRQEQLQAIDSKIRLFIASQKAVRAGFNASAQSAAKVPTLPEKTATTVKPEQPTTNNGSLATNLNEPGSKQN